MRLIIRVLRVVRAGAGVVAEQAGIDGLALAEVEVVVFGEVSAFAVVVHAAPDSCVGTHVVGCRYTPANERTTPMFDFSAQALLASAKAAAEDDKKKPRTAKKPAAAKKGK